MTGKAWCKEQEAAGRVASAFRKVESGYKTSTSVFNDPLPPAKVHPL